MNTASVAGLIAAPGIAPYNATKHAVVALSEGLFLELQAVGSPVGVSVLCPGYVRTRLMEHEPETASSPVGAIVADALRSGVAGGIDPAEVASQVADAVRAGRFWILTHPETREAPVERMRRAADGVNPSIALPG